LIGFVCYQDLFAVITIQGVFSPFFSLLELLILPPMLVMFFRFPQSQLVSFCDWTIFLHFVSLLCSFFLYHGFWVLPSLPSGFFRLLALLSELVFFV